MDFAEFLGSVSSSGLLVLMAIPLGMAALLVFFLVYFSRSNSKKAKMKLGTQPKSSPKNPPTPPAKTPPPNLPAESAPVDELNLNILNSRASTSPPPANPEPIDLAARLGLPAPPEPAPPPLVLPPQPVVVPPLPAPPPDEPIELLRLLRDPQSGRLVVEFAGQRYARLADIGDKKVGQYILQLAAHLLAFTNGMLAAPTGIQSVPAPKVGEAPLPPVELPPTLPPALAPTTPVSPQPVAPPPPPVSPAYITPIAPIVLTPEPAQPPRRGFFGRSEPADEPVLPPLNLAGQINQITQANLSRSPLAATTRLEIVADPGGGLQIRVNGRVYHSPDDIPDPEVKALIKDSIKQWEKS